MKKIILPAAILLLLSSTIQGQLEKIKDSTEINVKKVDAVQATGLLSHTSHLIPLVVITVIYKILRIYLIYSTNVLSFWI